MATITQSASITNAQDLGPLKVVQITVGSLKAVGKYYPNSTYF